MHPSSDRQPDPGPDRSQPAPNGAPPPRSARRRLGCLAKTGCGLLAFVVGAGLMLVFLVPPLAGRWMAREVQSEFAETRQGELRVAQVSLDWFRPQRVDAATLHGPDGVQIARAEVELPSILDLLRVFIALQSDEPAALGTIHVSFDADLVIDEDGTSNLERALALRDGVERARPVHMERTGTATLENILRLLNAEVLVRSRRISVSTPQTRASGVEVALVGLEARLTLTAGQPLVLVAAGSSSEGGRLTVDGRVAGLRETLAGVALEALQLEARLERLPTAIVAALLPQAHDLVELVGPLADGRLALDHTPEQATRAELELEGQGGRAHFSFLERDGVLELHPTAPNEATLAAPRHWLERRLTPFLPPGLRISPLAETLALTFTLGELSLPLEGPEPGVLDPSQVRLVARATLGGLQLTFAPPPDEEELAAGRPPGEPIEQRLLGASLELVLDPAAGLVAILLGELEGEGRLRSETRAEAAALRAILAGEAAAGLELDVSATSFPTALVDALARQDGLLLDVLGPTLDASAQAREIALAAPAPPGAEAQAERFEGARLRARLESGLGRVDFTGSLVGMRLVSTGDEGLSATARLSPLLSSRIIGPLLPLLVALEQPDGAPPLRIAVKNLSVPLEAAPGQIDALVRLELGDIRAQLLPTLGAHLSGVRELQPYLHRMLPFEVQVEQGLASYTALPLTLDGKTVELAGTFSLVSGALDLRTELPLQHLGGEVRELLRSVEQFVSPDLAVPVSLLGTLSRPRLRVPDSFVEDLVRDAARRGLEDQLQRGVREELEGRLPPAARDKLRGILERLPKKDG